MHMGVLVGVWACFCTGTGGCRVCLSTWVRTHMFKTKEATCERTDVLINRSGESSHKLYVYQIITSYTFNT